MNVRCPQCRTVYRVDPRKVPAAGIRARCVRCPGEFEVRADASTSAAERAEPVMSVRTESAAVEGSAASPVAEERETFAAEEAPEASGSGVEIAESVESESAADWTLPPPPFGSTDPNARAKRLARALVSDIVVYHRDRRERSLQQGTIRQEFREEIRKSWDEYVAQVGNEIARDTSYFREALNEILAGGARLF